MDPNLWLNREDALIIIGSRKLEFIGTICKDGGGNYPDPICPRWMAREKV
jgi:hypothetical protein